MSNELSGKLLSRLLHDHLQAVCLGHLSKENNLEELAYETVRLWRLPWVIMPINRMIFRFLLQIEANYHKWLKFRELLGMME